jgi:short-subunit dehydrogenase
MKKAIIIGASSGIGKALAIALARDGYKVGITGRRNMLLTELKVTNPEGYIMKSFDLTGLNSNQELNELATELAGVDLLIICSGIGDLNPTLDFGIEKQAIDVNVSGFTQVADWAFNYFERQGSGHLTAISSIAGIRGIDHAPAYNASKAYQINYLEGLRKKAAKQKLGIVVTDIRPGFVDTAMAKGEGLFWVASPEKAAKQILSAIQRKKRVAYITRRWVLIAWLLKILPYWIYEKM